MLDYFSIFTLGGAVLWCHEWSALRGNPVSALVQACLIEQRATDDKCFVYQGPMSTNYTLRWAQNNELGLVFVAVHRSVLTLPYVEELLARVKNVFEYHYRRDLMSYPDFGGKFQEILAKVETRQEAPAPRGAERKAPRAGSGSDDDEDDEDEEDGDGGGEDGSALGQQMAALEVAGGEAEQAGESAGGSGFDVGKLKALRKKKGGKSNPSTPTKRGAPGPKKGRHWGLAGSDEGEQLDFTDGQAASAPAGLKRAEGKSMMDEDESGEWSGTGGDDAPARSWIGNAFRKMNVAGQLELTKQDVGPILEVLKEKFVAKNVAEEVAQKLCDSVEANMVGKRLASFTRISTAVTQAVEQSLTHILSPGRNVNVLQEIQAAKREGEPYTIVFVGVNGVGKSTNLAKVAFWLMQHDLEVLIAACDTFRSGAVEQLRTHTQRLGVDLFERGYEKDPAAVAREAVKRAREQGKDVVLVDTAGRMQDNEPLMRALAKLVNTNDPNLVLFVGEALVGNEAVDQLTKFNRRLEELSTLSPPHKIDGVLLTKFDTIDTKVGAALSMVYTSGAPVVFVGCGQTYADLKRLNVKQIVSCLLE